MALDFPPSPNVGDIHTGPSGQSWIWDGDKWKTLGGAGGGGGGGGRYDNFTTTGTSEVLVLQGGPTINQPTIAQPRIRGVVNGLNAAAGEVGEFVTLSTVSYTINRTINSVNFSTNIANRLSAGDWLIESRINVRAVAPPLPDPPWHMYVEVSSIGGGRIVYGIGGVQNYNLTVGISRLPLDTISNVTGLVQISAPFDDTVQFAMYFNCWRMR